MYSHKQLGLEEPASYEEFKVRFSERAADRRKNGDLSGEGVAIGRVAWALEKQGESDLALEYMDRARSLLSSVEDEWWWYAELCHSTGVFKFHNIDLEAPPVEDFHEAINVRIAHDDLFGASQSWHNMAYTQLMMGWHDEALSSYERSSELLHHIEQGSDAEAAARADRHRGFVLSHVAFAAARHGTVEDALQKTVEYFAHVARTGVHREQVLALLAPGVAIASSSAVPDSLRDALVQLVGIPLDAEGWLRNAVNEAAAAMIAQDINVNTGLGAYLGSHLLALTELSHWCSANGRMDEADDCATEAVNLANARGWHGEAARIQRALGCGSKRG